MNQKLLLSACGLAFTLCMTAAPLTPTAALQRATGSTPHRIASAREATLAYTASTPDGVPAVYVFNKGNGGAIFVSASDIAIPVLGYTDSGEFDANNIPDALKAWLDGYSREIAYAEAKGVTANETLRNIEYPKDWEYIAPKLNTEWGQGWPYNLQAPNKCPTGCVATAMAQIVNYWKFPKRGHGYVEYTNAPSDEVLSMNFELQDFDWDNILDVYMPNSPTVTLNAVAYLMKACGYASKMGYQSGASGAITENACAGLIEHLGYSEDVRIFNRFEYPTSEWIEIVYNQLKNVGPVYYCGDSPSFGHAFVCDGYNGEGYFHFNWGWEGLSNGFFSLNALVPARQGTGGSVFDGFNFAQAIIGNIKPMDGTPSYSSEAMLTFLGNTMAKGKNNYMSFSFTPAYPANFVNNSDLVLNPVFGYKMVNLSTGRENYYGIDQLYINSNKYDNFPTVRPGAFFNHDVSMEMELDTQLPDGNYKAQIVWKQQGTDEWKDMLHQYSCHDYALVTKEGDKFTVESMPLYRFVVESAEVLTPLYMYNPCDIRFVVYNPTDIELTQGITPILYKSTSPLFVGDSQLVTVYPGERKTITMSFSFKMTELGSAPSPSTPTSFTLGAYDYNSVRYSADPNYSKKGLGDAYYGDLGKVSMYNSKPGGYLRLDDISIEGAGENDSSPDAEIFNVSDFSNIRVMANVSAVDGNVESPFSVTVYEYNDEEQKNGQIVAQQASADKISINSGKQAVASVALNIDDYDEETIYNAVAYYELNEVKVSLGNILFRYKEDDVVSFVNTIETESVAPRYFNLQGVEISNPQPGTLYIKVEGNKTSKVIEK